MITQPADHERPHVVLIHRYFYPLEAGSAGAGPRSLDIDTSSLGRVLGETLIKVEEVLIAERPDAVLVLGDTNSCIAAVMAKRMKIPVYHMEAGNRCFDENVPEETCLLYTSPSPRDRS